MDELQIETIAGIFDIPREMIRGLESNREIRGVLDFRYSDPNAYVQDYEGRRVRVEAVGVHSALPNEDSLYLNDLVFGMPKAEPWKWHTDDAATDRVTHLTAWSGERCVTVTPTGVVIIQPSVDFNVMWTTHGYPGSPVPIPARLQGRGG